MGEKIEITVFSRTPLISDLHETITSLIGQLGSSRLQIFVNIDNPFGLSLDSELTRLEAAGIKIGKAKDARFSLSLDSGDVLSKSFIYKATEYLSFNQAGFVCPEYTFRRASFRAIIAASENSNLPLNAVHATLIDRSKIGQVATPLSVIVKDTCVASADITTDLHHFIKTMPRAAALESPFLTPSCLATIKSQATTTKTKSTRAKVRSAVSSLSGRSKILRKIFSCPVTSADRHRLPDTYYTKQTIYISSQMRSELAFIAECKYALKGYESMTFANLTAHIAKFYSPLLADYQRISSAFHFDHYDYICVLPWLISGGIDLFAINYLKTISKLYPDFKILVILTNDFHKSFTKEELGLTSNVDFLNLPQAVSYAKNKEILMERLVHTIINTFSPEYLHIIASKVGYNVVIKAGDDFRSRGTKLLFSSYNYLVGPHHEYMGYTVEELPKAYRPGDTITTDNAKSKSIWVNQYGFREEDILIHNQLFTNVKDITPSTKDGIKILWAAHIRPEKNPDILLPIASALKKDKIEIDCYGLFVKDNWETEENPLDFAPDNLHYKGPYNDFFTDINLAEYDLFLYTSHADGTPNVILEAALAGLPIVSSDIGGIADATMNKATLVKNTYSADEFIAAIRDTLSHHEESIKNAAALKKSLLEAHSEKTFELQVKSMLNRSQNV